MRGIFALFLLLVGCSCSESTVGVTVDSSQNIARDTALVASTMREWEAAVGGHREFTLELSYEEYSPWSDNASELGSCQRLGDAQHLKIDVGHLEALKGSEFAAAFRVTLLHELLHAHLSCSGEDHSSDPGSILFPKVGRANIHARLTATQIAGARLGLPSR